MKLLFTIVLTLFLSPFALAVEIPDGWDLRHNKFDGVPVIQLTKQNDTDGSMTIMWNYVTDSTILVFQRKNQKEKITAFNAIYIDGNLIEHSKYCHKNKKCISHDALQVPLGSSDYDPLNDGLIITFKYEMENKHYVDEISLIGSRFGLSEFLELSIIIKKDMDKLLDINQ